MSTKRKNITAPGGCEKKKRKAIDLEMKMKIINDYETGKKVKVISNDFGLAHSTVSMILKDKEKVKEAAKSSTGFKAIITRQRKGLIHEMEKLLAVWFDDQVHKKMPLSLLIIQAKARTIFNMLKEQEGSTETFRASNGWFQRFRRRFNLLNRCVNDEAASADAEAPEKFVDELHEMIQIDGYSPEQISDTQKHVEKEVAEEKRVDEMHKEFTVEGLSSVFSKINEALFELECMDNNVERFMKVEQQMNELLMCYREIYEEKKKITKQTILTSFYIKATTPTSPAISSPSSPLPGPSTANDLDFDSDDIKPLSHKKR